MIRNKKRNNISVSIKHEVNIQKGHAVAFDFDGVIHKYSKGWEDGSIYDDYNREVIEIIEELMHNGIPVFILSTRKPAQIKEWWDEHLSKRIPCEIVYESYNFWDNTKSVGITNRKLPAQLYIDDRAYRYHGESRDDFFSNLSCY